MKDTDVSVFVKIASGSSAVPIGSSISVFALISFVSRTQAFKPPAPSTNIIPVPEIVTGDDLASESGSYPAVPVTFVISLVTGVGLPPVKNPSYPHRNNAGLRRAHYLQSDNL